MCPTPHPSPTSAWCKLRGGWETASSLSCADTSESRSCGATLSNMPGGEGHREGHCQKDTAAALDSELPWA